MHEVVSFEEVFHRTKFLVFERPFIKPGIQERGTEFGERGECSLGLRGIS